jgi:hypothetical protein
MNAAMQKVAGSALRAPQVVSPWRSQVRCQSLAASVASQSKKTQASKWADYSSVSVHELQPGPCQQSWDTRDKDARQSATQIRDPSKIKAMNAAISQYGFINQVSATSGVSLQE